MKCLQSTVAVLQKASTHQGDPYRIEMGDPVGLFF
jgi:hypothetical protein